MQPRAMASLPPLSERPLLRYVTFGALYVAISNLGLSVGAAWMGALSERVGWPWVVGSYVVFASFSFVLLWYVGLDRHQPRLEGLERGAAPGLLPALEPTAVVAPLLADEEPEVANL